MRPDDFWKPETPGLCWVCGKASEYAYLDMAYQHKDCASYPSLEGDVRIIAGVRYMNIDFIIYQETWWHLAPEDEHPTTECGWFRT